MAADIPDVRVHAELLGLSETPVLHGRLADAATLVAALGERVRARMATHAGIGRSNIGGWHSASDMLDWGGPPAQTIADTAVKMAKRLSHFEGRDPQSVGWSVKMWANVSPPGAINMSHAHPGVLWAAVFYVDLGDPPKPDEAGGEAGGELYFEDPRFPLTLARLPGFRMIGIDGQPQPVEHRIAPAAGDLIVFPCWLRHGVRPHHGSGDRISIAMNIDVNA